MNRNSKSPVRALEEARHHLAGRTKCRVQGAIDVESGDDKIARGPAVTCRSRDYNAAVGLNSNGLSAGDFGSRQELHANKSQGAKRLVQSTVGCKSSNQKAVGSNAIKLVYRGYHDLAVLLNGYRVGLLKPRHDGFFKPNRNLSVRAKGRVERRVGIVPGKRDERARGCSV